MVGWVSSVEPVPPYDDNDVKTHLKVTKLEEHKEKEEEEKEEDVPLRDPVANFKSSSVEPIAQPSVAVVHQKIPAECFTGSFDCEEEPEEGKEKHMCCAYM